MDELIEPTDPHTLHRTDGPETSVEGAYAVDSRKAEEIVLDIHIARGEMGCTLEQMIADAEGQLSAVSLRNVTARRSKLYQKGLLLKTGHSIVSLDSGVSQEIYVAKEVLSPGLIEYIRRDPNAHNPSLNPESTVRPFEIGVKKVMGRFLLYIGIGQGESRGCNNESLNCSADTIEEIHEQINLNEYLTNPDLWWAIVRKNTMQIEKSYDARKIDDVDPDPS
jgi:hypothetical protein